MPARIVAVILTTLALSGASWGWHPEAASAEPMKALLLSPLVAEFGEIDSPVLPTAIALRLMDYAKEEFQGRTGWDCLNPVWDPSVSPNAPRSQIAELRTGLTADDIRNQYHATVQLDVQPRGGQRAESFRDYWYEITSRSGDPLVETPLEGELLNPETV